MQLPGVDKIVGLFEKNADIIGGVYGFMQDPLGDNRGFAGAVPFMFDRITHWKVPKNFVEIYTWAFKDAKNYTAMKNGILAAIIGYFVKEVGGDINPTIRRLGSIIQKVGTGAAVGSAVAAFVFVPAIAASKPDPSLYTGRGGGGHGGGNSGYVY